MYIGSVADAATQPVPGQLLHVGTLTNTLDILDARTRLRVALTSFDYADAVVAMCAAPDAVYVCTQEVAWLDGCTLRHIDGKGVVALHQVGSSVDGAVTTMAYYPPLKRLFVATSKGLYVWHTITVYLMALTCAVDLIL